jgi:hypothetical protein
MIGFVNRYALIAGRSCCAGRSWVSLDRSLARRAGDTPPGSCEPPCFDVSSDPDEVTVAGRPDPDEVTVGDRPVPEPDQAPVAGP